MPPRWTCAWQGCGLSYSFKQNGERRYYHEQHLIKHPEKQSDIPVLATTPQEQDNSVIEKSPMIASLSSASTTTTITDVISLETWEGAGYNAHPIGIIHTKLYLMAFAFFEIWRKYPQGNPHCCWTRHRTAKQHYFFTLAGFEAVSNEFTRNNHTVTWEIISRLILTPRAKH
eukprot:Lithocolla_globosa_v1_NODE_1294_length_2695_cov_6.288258.p2 type:complete len:172 gc:universal NODE_1294_length_2695_cov_6.288258:796-281(-)